MGPKILCIDIGGSFIKARVFDDQKKPLSDRLKSGTPPHMRPSRALKILRALADQMPSFDCIAAGFPGVVKEGKTWTATNLGQGWVGFDLRRALERELDAPVRVANDADVQGLAIIQGIGTELLLTLGTGLGSALFHEGVLIPNLQLGHHPFQKNRTYEDLLGKRGLKRSGKRIWNRDLGKAIVSLSKVFNWDRLYLGGGNATKIEGPMPAGVRVVSNENGLTGGVLLWELSGTASMKRKRSLLQPLPRQKAA